MIFINIICIIMNELKSYLQVIEGEHELRGTTVAVKSEVRRNAEDIHYLLG